MASTRNEMNWAANYVRGMREQHKKDMDGRRSRASDVVVESKIQAVEDAFVALFTASNLAFKEGYFREACRVR